MDQLESNKKADIKLLKHLSFSGLLKNCKTFELMRMNWFIKFEAS